jgi:hypothetical protein
MGFGPCRQCPPERVRLKNGKTSCNTGEPCGVSLGGSVEQDVPVRVNASLFDDVDHFAVTILDLSSQDLQHHILQAGDWIEAGVRLE